ncbi:MAG TPA: hypothetical protein VGN86_08140 [Pyrinomonadaceae bacterium]|nr:hypothetical protein [Pyrinomonadaceae bacterium]
MKLTRKVYVASKLDQDTLNKAFQWPEGFERTVDPEDAEFIVLDLANKPKDYIKFFGDKKALPVPTQNIPFFLVALDKELPADFDVIKGRYEPIEPPVYHSAKDLFNALQWLQSIFPFYNEKKMSLEELARASGSLALVVARTRGSGLPPE